MPPKINPLKLNALQLRTLTILQELAKDPSHALPPEANRKLTRQRPAPRKHL